MIDRGFTTKGSEQYFADREARITAHIVDAKTKIDEIETRVRAEMVEIGERRDRIRHHLQGFIAARNELVEHREKTVRLVDELHAVIGICDEQLPTLDAMLDELEKDYGTEDVALQGAEQSRARQLKKHERKKTRYELRGARLQLRKTLFLGPQNGETKTPQETATVEYTGDGITGREFTQP
jgi:hypothetical protein